MKVKFIINTYMLTSLVCKAYLTSVLDIFVEESKHALISALAEDLVHSDTQVEVLGTRPDTEQYAEEELLSPTDKRQLEVEPLRADLQVSHSIDMDTQTLDVPSKAPHSVYNNVSMLAFCL